MSDEYYQRCREVVQQAKERLTLADVWDLAPFSQQDPCPERDRVVRSPLRPDTHPSFSVFSNGQAFADKSRAAEGIKGGVWEFVKFASPDLDDSAISRVLVDRAGLSWPVKEESKRKKEEGEKELSPEEKVAARTALLREERLAYGRRQRDERQRQERKRREAWRPQGVARAIEQWPGCVEERFESGRMWGLDRDKVLQKLADRRGWPVDWAVELAGMGVLSWPMLPWHWEGKKGATRTGSWLVEAPSGGGIDRYPVGYHQPYWSAKRERKDWLYVPFAPKRSDRPRGFMASLAAEAEERGHGPGGARASEAMVVDLPLVLGACEAPRLVAILEGEWDAATWWGAVGNLAGDGSGLDDVVAFGIRGAGGTEVFLRYYGPWLAKVKPRVWLLPDADKAGQGWLPPRRLADRPAGRVYFSEKLERLTERAPVVSVPSGIGVKDFNDFWRDRRPRMEDMFSWMTKLEVL